MNVQLWTPTEFTFAPVSTSNTNCGMIFYSVVGDEAATAPLVTMDSFSNKVIINAMDKVSVGAINFSIKACHQNMRYWDEIKCSQSEPIIVTI